MLWEVREAVREELTWRFFNAAIAMSTSSMCRDVRQADRHHAAISDGRPRLKVSRKRETMGSARNNAKTLKKSDKWITPESSAVEENVQAIKRWERATLLARSKAEQVSDWIACTAGAGRSCCFMCFGSACG